MTATCKNRRLIAVQSTLAVLFVLTIVPHAESSQGLFNLTGCLQAKLFGVLARGSPSANAKTIGLLRISIYDGAVLGSISFSSLVANRSIGSVDLHNNLKNLDAALGPGWITIKEVALKKPKNATRSIFGPQLVTTTSLADFLGAKRGSTVFVRDDGTSTGQPEVIAIGTVKKANKKSCI